MPTPKIHLLHLEDSTDDRFIVQRTLAQGGLHCEIVWACTCEEFLGALERQRFDIILADQALGGFDGFTALKLVKEKRPETPFIFVTGSMGEEKAIETMKYGATDYVLKDRLTRLVPAVQRALEERWEQERRRKAEDKIRHQAKLLDKAKDAIIETDLHNRVLFWNKGAQVIYGWSDAEMLGKNIEELLPGDDPSTLGQARKKTIETGEWTGELEARSKSGGRVIAHSHWTLVKDEAGNPESILSINTDVTERKQLEAQYFRSQRLETIGILAGGIAHDLNNVLAPILMVSQLLRMNLPDEGESAELLQTLESSAEHGADLIKQILSFTRGVTGEHAEVQVGHLIREIEKLLKETLPRSIELKTTLQRDLWTIKGSPAQISQVLMNLCVNARDAMPNGGRISVLAENINVDEAFVRIHVDAKIGTYLAISVTDTGTGIPPEVLNHIYEPFYSTKEVGKGTGLGLSTVKSIVKNHGGFIHVYTETGKGTCFKAYFPAIATPEVEGKAREQQTRLLPGNGELVLVVDDEPAVLRTTEKILQRFGYNVITATDGVDGTAAFVKHAGEIALVITDIMMPRMGGRAMIQTLRKLKPDLKIVATSGMMEAHEASELAGMRDLVLLPKPFSTDQLLSTITTALSKKRIS